MIHRKHRDLLVWKEGIVLVKLVYQLTSSFPKSEQFGLTSQMRRAAVSVPANIAEGAARRSRAELRQYVSIARGSLAELDTHFEIAIELEFVEREHSALELLDRVSLLVERLHASLAPKA